LKVVINSCYGGFSLSPKAEKRYLELQGKEAYFFTYKYNDNGVREDYIPIDVDDEDIGLFHTCYTIPNPKEHIGSAPYDEQEKYMVDGKLDRDVYKNACDLFNEKYSEVCFTSRQIERNDPLLVQVVEELGEKANGSCAELTVIEIPDDVEWHVAEYDGYEHIAENHRTWG
jgi:hypothetical protein